MENFEVNEIETVVWRLEGSVKIDGEEHSFTFTYDERDGETWSDLSDDNIIDTNELLEQFEAACMKELEKTW